MRIEKVEVPVPTALAAYLSQERGWLLIEWNDNYGFWDVTGRFATQKAVDRVVALILAGHPHYSDGSPDE